jgi:GntR family transcriptional regulator
MISVGMSPTSSTLEDYAQRHRYVLSDTASIPLYYQLFRLLERFTAERHLHPGDRFPSEEAIASAFNVSRPTANRATRELLDRGWLHRERGRGTFVAQGSYVELALLSDELSLSSQFRGRHRLTSRTISCRQVRAPQAVSDALTLPPNEAVLELRRLRCVDERPILVGDTYLQASRFPGFSGENLVDGSLFETLRVNYHVPVCRCERWLEAFDVLSQDVADLLQIPLLAPILLVRGLAYTKDGDAVACMTGHVREGISFQATGRSHAAAETRTAKTFEQTVEQEDPLCT